MPMFTLDEAIELSQAVAREVYEGAASNDSPWWRRINGRYEPVEFTVFAGPIQALSPGDFPSGTAFDLLVSQAEIEVYFDFNNQPQGVPLVILYDIDLEVEDGVYTGDVKVKGRLYACCL